jgi:pantetheine-phosphate adenylyltransferase
MKTCVYPGSFDPFTNGHLDIALRAGDLFDKVVILISQNPGKGERFLPIPLKWLLVDIYYYRV